MSIAVRDLLQIWRLDLVFRCLERRLRYVRLTRCGVETEDQGAWEET